MKHFLLFNFVFLILVFETEAQSWELKKDKEEIKVFTKINPSSPFDLLKAECDISVNKNELLDLVFDVSRHTEWVYNAVKSELIKRSAKYDIIYYGETYAPWPVSNRDLVIHLTAVTDSLSGICTIKAISEPDLMPLVSGKIRVPRSESIWRLVPIGDRKTHVIYTLDIDPGGSLPSWLVNFASVEGPFLSFKKMKSILIRQ